MKKLIFTILALSLVLGGCWLSGDERQMTEDGMEVGDEETVDVEADVEVSEGEIDISEWKTYRDEKYGYEIRYPKDWEIERRYYEIDSVIGFETSDYGRTDQETKGYAVYVKFLTLPNVGGYSGPASNFDIKKEIVIDQDIEAIEYVVKKPDAVLKGHPAQIQFEVPGYRVLIEGGFASVNKKEFLVIFEQIAKTFKFID